MAKKEIIEILVEGGNAKPDATNARRFAALKLDVNKVFEEINQKTKDYLGLQIPVKIEIDEETKSFNVNVGILPTTSLIKKELGIEKAAISAEEKAKGKEFLGNLTFQQVTKIAKLKMEQMLTKDLKNAIKQVIGTATSMPILIENKKPKEILKEIEEGKYDKLIK